MKRRKLIIAGSGPAGYTAAIYAGREGLEPVVVRGATPGGQMTTTTSVENFPGFAAPIDGPELMQAMADQALNCGASFIDDTVARFELEDDPKRVVLDNGDSLESDAVVLAMGAQARWLDVPGEHELTGRGVSACATCDAPFFRNQRVAVIGGGNTALTEALHLARIAREVVVIHRRQSFRGERTLVERLMRQSNVRLALERRVVRMVGDGSGGIGGDNLAALELADTRPEGHGGGHGGGTTERLEVEGAFVAIGHLPASRLVEDQLDLEDDGTVRVDAGTSRTSLAGVFAAGDLVDRLGYRQAVTAAGSGCIAGLDAAAWLHERDG